MSNFWFRGQPSTAGHYWQMHPWTWQSWEAGLAQTDLCALPNMLVGDGPIRLLSMSAAHQADSTNVVQDAVVLALSFDMALASATANRPEEEPALKRSLWLTIARHIVHQHPSQDQACLHLLLTHDSLNATTATAC